MNKLHSAIFLAIMLLPTFASGQEGYRQAGFRSGYRGGFFFQMTVDAGTTEIGYNTMLGFNNNGIQLTGLRIIYERPVVDISPDLYFGWGYGGHVGFIVTDNIMYLGERFNFPNERFCPVFGADGWVGAEYRFPNIPINIGVNFKPFVELTIPAFVKVMPGDAGISISYVF
ncbi:MAG: hypothetical protein QG576_366 [Bacteroidota bacterium]|nr:hypothetical protein [Bacteroidota bacterium]